MTTIILLEITFQLNYYIRNGEFLFYRVSPPIYVEDNEYGHRVKPYLKIRHKTDEFNVINYTNSKGFRCSKNIEEYKDLENKYNIILNGPSFAFGWGVNYEQSFAALLNNHLQESNLGRKGIQIIDFGVPSRPLSVQINFFKNEGRHFKPSLVLQFVYGSMIADINDPRHYVEDGYLIKKRERDQYLIRKIKKSGIMFYSWLAYSRLLSLLRDNIGYNDIIGAGRELRNYTKFDVNSSEVKTSLNYYFEFNSFCKLINTKLILIYFPLSYVVHPEDVVRWEFYGVEDIKDQIIFNREFCDYLNNKGVVCLNLTDDMINEAINSNKRLYYWVDIHWTPYGNEIAAKVVAKYILNNKKYYFKND